jgi:hypothetical protein
MREMDHPSYFCLFPDGKYRFCASGSAPHQLSSCPCAPFAERKEERSARGGSWFNSISLQLPCHLGGRFCRCISSEADLKWKGTYLPLSCPLGHSLYSMNGSTRQFHISARPHNSIALIRCSRIFYKAVIMKPPFLYAIEHKIPPSLPFLCVECV